MPVLEKLNVYDLEGVGVIVGVDAIVPVPVFDSVYVYVFDAVPEPVWVGVGELVGVPVPEVVGVLDGVLGGVADAEERQEPSGNVHVVPDKDPP